MSSNERDTTQNRDQWGEPVPSGSPDSGYGQPYPGQTWGAGQQPASTAHGVGPGHQDQYPGYGHQDQYPGYGHQDQNAGYGQQDQYPGYGQQDQNAGYGQQGHFGGYGQAYPGGAGQEYGNQMAGSPTPGRVDLGGTLGRAWGLLTGNLVPWVVFTLIVLVTSGILSVIPNAAEQGGGTWLALQYLGGILSFVVSTIFTVMMIRAALSEIDGHKPALGDFFTVTALGTALVANLLMAVAVLVGAFVFLVGALVAVFFLYWTLYFVVDRRLGVFAALQASVKAIGSQPGPLLGLAVVNFFILVAGGLLLGVGLLVAYPLVILASAVAYRTVTGPSVSDQANQASTPGYTY